MNMLPYRHCVIGEKMLKFPQGTKKGNLNMLKRKIKIGN